MRDRPTGIGVAAYLAAGLGLVALAVSHLAAERSDAAKQAIHGLGKAWMPGAEGIGPYAGKETIALIVWLGSWIVLHQWLKAKDVSVKWSGVLFLALIGIATTLLWPPVTEWCVHVIKGI